MWLKFHIKDLRTFHFNPVPMCKVKNIISYFPSNRYFIAIFVNISYINPEKDIRI